MKEVEQNMADPRGQIEGFGKLVEVRSRRLLTSPPPARIALVARPPANSLTLITCNRSQ